MQAAISTRNARAPDGALKTRAAAGCPGGRLRFSNV